MVYQIQQSATGAWAVTCNGVVFANAYDRGHALAMARELQRGAIQAAAAEVSA